MSINREIPSFKAIKEYRKRFNENTFREYEKLIAKPNFRKNYESLIKGINPLTNRKIKINGKTYNKILSNFYVRTTHKYTNGTTWFNTIFTELDTIDKDPYLTETKKNK